MLRLTLLATLGLYSSVLTYPDSMDDKFMSFFNVVGRLVDHDKKCGLKEEKIATLMEQLKDSKAIIEKMNKSQTDLTTDESKTLVPNYAASTYTRWGRSTCPENATIVYEGYTAGSSHGHTGGAANYLCLPTNPDWENHKEIQFGLAFIYGAENQTSKSMLDKLYEHDVPCAVCRVPRADIIMVPGKNICYQNYNLEYKGYLMAGKYDHPAGSEFVCVDGDAEPASNSDIYDHNGKLFYFVQAKCGALKCPPYKENDYLTCAVCSF